MTYDVVIIGSGMTGMVAALKAIEMGKKTIVVSHGASTMQVMSGCIDLYGDDRNPWPALRELVSSNPAHPYALLTEEEIREALSFFAVQMKESCPYHYQKGFTNFRIPNVFGEERSTCLLPEGQLAGQLAAVNPELRVLVVGLKGYPDFSAELMVEGMKKRGYQGWQAAEFDLGCLQVPDELNERVQRAGTSSQRHKRLSYNSVEIAKRLEKGWQHFAEELRGRVQGFDAAAFPAVLGLDEHLLVKRGLEKYLGIRVFEVPAIHPSLPGMRLARSFAAELRESGCDLLQGFPVVSAESEEGWCSSIIVNTPGRSRCIRGKNFILATGGVLGGGIVAERKGAREVVFRLPVANSAADAYIKADPHSAQTADLTAARTAALADIHSFRTAALADDDNKERSGMLGNQWKTDFPQFPTSESDLRHQASISQAVPSEDEIRSRSLNVKELGEADFTQPPASGLRHPTSISQAGVRVNQQLQPVGEDGSLLLENVFCAGRILAGYDPYIEGSGAGVAVTTGYKAAVEAGRMTDDE
jgi:glycerol-3-phosphate dehydrogenase subunit B